jgi:hypothetical protein
VNEIEAFAICLAAVVSESEQRVGDLTDEVIDGSVAWKGLARSLRKLSNLPTDGSDR